MNHTIFFLAFVTSIFLSYRFGVLACEQDSGIVVNTITWMLITAANIAAVGGVLYLYKNKK